MRAGARNGSSTISAVSNSSIASCGGQRQDPVAAQPGQAGGVQPAGHGAGLLPQPPGQRHRRQPVGPPMRGQPVQERVGRRIIGLARRADQPGHRRKHHERRQIQLARQLVQVPRRVDLGPQHRVDPLGCQRRHDRVVEHPGGMNDRRQRLLHRNIGDHLRQRRPVGRVAGHHLHLRTRSPEFGRQLRPTPAHPGRAGSAAPDAAPRAESPRVEPTPNPPCRYRR